MTNKNGPRLKNLAMFKVWATDGELRSLMPLIALIAFLILIVIRVVVASRIAANSLALFVS